MAGTYTPNGGSASPGEATDVSKIVVTGTGASMAEFHDADLAASYQLLAPTNGALNMSLSNPVKPGDSKALKLTIKVSGTKTVEADYVYLEGKDCEGDP